MRGVRGVAHQHHMRPAVEMTPRAADQAGETEPRRPAQMPRVAHQLGAVKRFGEQVFAELDRSLANPACRGRALVRFLRRLDDEGRGFAVEFVDVRLKPAMLGAAEIEREGVEQLVGAEPDVAVRPDDEVGLETSPIALADLRVDAVAGDDQSASGKSRSESTSCSNASSTPSCSQRRLQDVEQMLAADADEAVPCRALPAALEDQFDVVPVIEGLGDLLRARGIGLPHRLHHRVGKHDAPAERVVRLVALDDRDACSGGGSFISSPK